MTDALAYLDGLFHDDSDDDGAFNWDVNDHVAASVPDAWKAEAVAPDTNAPPGGDGGAPHAEEPVEAFDVDRWQQTMQAFHRQEEERRVMIDVDADRPAEREMPRTTVRSIEKWNRQTECRTALDWDAVEHELERIERRHRPLDHRRRHDAKRPAIAADRVRSLISDFGESIVNGPWFVCVICRRQFENQPQLDRHCKESIYHLLNVRELERTGYSVSLPSLQMQTPSEFAAFTDSIGMELLKNMGWKVGDQIGCGRETMEVPVGSVQGRTGIGATPARKETPTERARRRFYK